VSAEGGGTGLPALPYPDWTDTRTSLHLACQIVGKVRAALHPKKNHWWHVPLYVSVDGLTTRSIPLAGGDGLEIAFRLAEAPALRVERAGGGVREVALEGDLTIARFYRTLMEHLTALGVDVRIRARPFDLPFDTPFADDTEHGTWRADALHRFHRALLFSAGAFERFSGRFLGKQTPVHFFWHSFDLALTRFNGREAPPFEGEVDPVTREAYSHEVVSFGFWPGDPYTPEPAYYAYVHPEPEGITCEPLSPASARWENPRGRGHLALLGYDVVRAAADPGAEVLEFLESAYQAAVQHATGWDAARFRTDWSP
jgi:hypothetical protein